MDGSVDGHESLILLLDKLVDKPAGIIRGNLFHDTFDIVPGLLELSDVVLEVLYVDVLLLCFNIFPAFGALLSLKREERKLRIILAEAIL